MGPYLLFQSFSFIISVVLARPSPLPGMDGTLQDGTTL